MKKFSLFLMALVVLAAAVWQGITLLGPAGHKIPAASAHRPEVAAAQQSPLPGSLVPTPAAATKLVPKDEAPMTDHLEKRRSLARHWQQPFNPIDRLCPKKRLLLLRYFRKSPRRRYSQPPFRLLCLAAVLPPSSSKPPSNPQRQPTTTQKHPDLSRRRSR